MHYLRSFMSRQPVSQSASQPVSQSASQPDTSAPTGSLNGHQVRVLTENEQTAEKAFPSSNDETGQTSFCATGGSFSSENRAKRQLYTEILNNPKVENKEKALGALLAANIKNAEDATDFKSYNRQFFPR